MLGKIESVWGAFLRALGWASGVGLCLLALMVSTDVAVRALTGKPIIGVFELAQLILVLVFFFAVGRVEFVNQQIKVDIVSAQARGRLATALRLLDGLAGLLFFVVILWSGSVEWLKAYRGGFLERGLVEFPTTIPVGMLVFGAFVMCITLVLVVWRSLADTIRGVGSEGPLAGNR